MNCNNCNCNKRAVAFDLTMWIIRIILIGIALYFISAIVRSGTTTLLTTNDLDYELLLERPLYNPAGFMYVDPDTHRSYPHVIDLSKFQQTTLDNLFTDTKPFALAYTLYPFEGHAPQSIQIVYYNKAQFDIMAPLTWSQNYGEFQRNKTVLVRESEGMLMPQTLVMHIVFKR